VQPNRISIWHQLAVQGIGGGAILNLSDIIISDLVPLADRGLYEGLLGLTWSLASGIGPPIVCSSFLLPFYHLIWYIGWCVRPKGILAMDILLVFFYYDIVRKLEPFLDINLPLTAIAFVLVLFCLRVRTPSGSVRDKLLRIDWLFVHSSIYFYIC
jgi:MFS family permease